MCTAALFPIAKTWKQPKSPPRGEWISKMHSTRTAEPLVLGSWWMLGSSARAEVVQHQVGLDQEQPEDSMALRRKVTERFRDFLLSV